MGAEGSRARGGGKRERPDNTKCFIFKGAAGEGAEEEGLLAEPLRHCR